MNELPDNDLPPQASALDGEEAVAQLRLILDAVPLLISYVDADLRYRFANRAYAEWFTYPVSDVIGCTVWEVVGEAAFKVVEGYLREALAGKRTTYETVVPYEVGGTRYVHTDLIPDRDSQGVVQGYIAVISDITARRRAEEEREAALAAQEEALSALRQREREFAVLVENSPDIISRFGPDLRLLYTSPAVTAATGLPPEFFIGKTHEEMGMPPEMFRVADQSLAKSFATGEPDAITFSIPQPEGGARHFEAVGVPLIGTNGVVEAVMTVSRDITARRLAEEERAAVLAEREALVRNMAEAALRQRAFVRDVLFSVSEGRFQLCYSPDDLPVPLAEVKRNIPLTPASLSAFRRQVREAALACGMPEDRMHDLITSVGEASMNAVVHAGGGVAHIYAGARSGNKREACGCVQVWIQDQGAGIAEAMLHRAMLERGFTTAGTLGHGFFLMMRCADRLYLLTGETGTTLIIEQDHAPALPAWLQDDRFHA